MVRSPGECLPTGLDRIACYVTGNYKDGISKDPASQVIVNCQGPGCYGLNDEENDMRQVLRRIAIHGALAAIVLGIIGLMLSELATMWMAATLAGKSPANAKVPDTSAMRMRLPLLMAVSGFTFVAVGEVAMYYWRRNRPSTGSPQPSDDTAKLLEDLLAKEEAKTTNSQEGVVQSAPESQNNASLEPAAHSPDGGN
jgi:hypothetical protein